MANSLYFAVAEFSLAALATLAYSFYKFPSSWKVGIGFVTASLFFALVRVFATWTVYRPYYSSMLLAGAAYYGMLFGAIIFGIAAILEHIVCGGSGPYATKR